MRVFRSFHNPVSETRERLLADVRQRFAAMTADEFEACLRTLPADSHAAARRLRAAQQAKDATLQPSLVDVRPVDTSTGR